MFGLDRRCNMCLLRSGKKVGGILLFWGIAKSAVKEYVGS
jgi:hypothetical protein